MGRRKRRAAHRLWVAMASRTTWGMRGDMLFEEIQRVSDASELGRSVKRPPDVDEDDGDERDPQKSDGEQGKVDTYC